jgi:hypothetical protein
VDLIDLSQWDPRNALLAIETAVLWLLLRRLRTDEIKRDECKEALRESQEILETASRLHSEATRMLEESSEYLRRSRPE